MLKNSNLVDAAIPAIKASRLQRALLREPVDKTPIWLMRQAGRYLPEYRELRKKTPDFMQFCSTPELAAEATMQPLERFDLDAAIIFSDILVIPYAMGMEVEFVKGEGPHFPRPIGSERDIQALSTSGLEKLDFIMSAIRLVVNRLQNKIPLIGFAGSPWTCATYMIEGGSSKTFSKIKTLCYRQPLLMHDLLRRLTEITIAYLNEQIKAGVQVVMLFDTWGGVLSGEDYIDFSLNYLRQIANSLVRERNGLKIPVIFFTKGGGQWLDKIAHAGCDAIGLDWMTDIGEARRLIGHRVALQGNMDPCLLLTDPEKVQQKAQSILKTYGSGPGHVFNLGHGILPETPIENVQALIEAVHNPCSL